MKPLTAILLAAGEGKRMHSARPKVLHEIAGRPLVGWGLEAARAAVAETPVLVIGHAADAVRAAIGDAARYALQPEQRGTGHALACARAYFEGRKGRVLVLAGDMPLLRPETLRKLAEAPGAAALLTTRLPEPKGYGRILRDAEGGVAGIVEERDASEAERAIEEVNVSAYCFEISALVDCLDRLTCENAQGEYYLTDCIALLHRAGQRISAVEIPREEGMGVNDRAELAACAAVLRARINADHMRAGVTMLDPAAVYLDASVSLGEDCTLYPGVVLEGETMIGPGTTLYPGTRLIDCTVGANCALQAVVGREAKVGDAVTIGPFVQLRPGTEIADGCKIGDFVEIKNAVVGPGTKLPHLSYIGDADLGARVNVGCGTAFANFDGRKKHRTKIGDDAFIGCNTSLVAPVSVGARAYTAAGSAITEDIPDEALAIARARQITKEGRGEPLRRRN